MQSHIAHAGTHLLNGRAATVLAAVIVGIYLGASTISEIDPFYRNGQAYSGDGSYTIDGWRGADAVQPPAPPPEAPMRSFGLAWAPALPRDYPDYPIDSGAYASDRGPDDATSGDRVVDGRDCPDCSGIVEPVPELLPIPPCTEADPACAPEDQDEEAAVDEVASAQPADF